MKKKPYTANIKGIEWRFHLQTQRAYVRDHGKDSDAITYPYDKDVYFNSSRLTPHVIRHELMHVYVASSGTSSANLTAEQMEELCSEIYEQHGPEMDMLVDKLLEHFLR
jgi:hypothetical protein